MSFLKHNHVYMQQINIPIHLYTQWLGDIYNMCM
jgi:hypothetical protein